MKFYFVVFILEIASSIAASFEVAAKGEIILLPRSMVKLKTRYLLFNFFLLENSGSLAHFIRKRRMAGGSDDRQTWKNSMLL